MKLTDLIGQCADLLVQHGDLEVVVYSTEDIHTPDLQVHPTTFDDEQNKLVIR